jgi:hypothetical protein
MNENTLKGVARQAMEGKPDDSRTVLALVVALQAATHGILENIEPLMSEEEPTSEDKKRVVREITAALSGSADFFAFAEHARALMPHLMLMDQAFKR